MLCEGGDKCCFCLFTFALIDCRNLVSVAFRENNQIQRQSETPGKYQFDFQGI